MEAQNLYKSFLHVCAAVIQCTELAKGLQLLFSPCLGLSVGQRSVILPLHLLLGLAVAKDQLQLSVALELD